MPTGQALARMKRGQIPLLEHVALGLWAIRHAAHPRVTALGPCAFGQAFSTEHVGQWPSCFHVGAKCGEQLELDFRFHPHLGRREAQSRRYAASERRSRPGSSFSPRQCDLGLPPPRQSVVLTQNNNELEPPHFHRSCRPCRSSRNGLRPNRTVRPNGSSADHGLAFDESSAGCSTDAGHRNGRFPWPSPSPRTSGWSDCRPPRCSSRRHSDSARLDPGTNRSDPDAARSTAASHV